jgi:signal transduction histidine kinase
VVSVRVRNAGSPIPPSAVDELFEPFRRGDNAVDGSGHLGLGLFIVREIARAHGDRLGLERGGETTFELAAQDRPGVAASAASSAAAAAPG